MLRQLGVDTVLWAAVAVAVAHLLAALFGPVDLTADGRHTLAPVSHDTARGLAEPVVARVFFSSGMAAPYHEHRRTALELLRALARASDGRLVVVDQDPAVDPAVAAAAREAGIRPVPYVARDGDEAQRRTVFLGVLLEQGERRVVLDVLPQVERMEYDLVRGLRAVTTPGDERPSIGWVVGHGEPDPSALPDEHPLSAVIAELGAGAELQPTRLDGPSAHDVLLLLAPSSPVPLADQVWLEQHVMGGGAVVAFVGSYSPVANGELAQVPHGLQRLWGHWGVELGAEVLLDRLSNDRLALPGPGGQRVPAVRHPLALVSRNLDRSARPVRELDRLVLPFASPVRPVEPGPPEAERQVWARTGGSAVAVEELPGLDPRTLAEPIPGEVAGPHEVMVAVTGSVPSLFASRPLPDGVELSQAERVATSRPTRLVVVGSSHAAVNHPDLVANLVDWALDDPALLRIRSRGGPAPALELSGPPGRVKAWVVGGPALAVGLLVAALGWRRRRGAG